MYKIRLESLGGFGANLVSKLIGEVGFKYLNCYARAFSSYGSEKRGSPVKGYIYLSDKPIAINTPITEPDLLCIFTMSLAGNENLICGVNENTNVIINTDLPADIAAEKLKLPSCNVWTIDATKYANMYHSRVNMVLFGVISKASEFLDINHCISIIKDNIVQNGNIDALKAGYENCNFKKFISDYPTQKYDIAKNNSAFGGIIPSTGSTITNNLAGCREGFMPEYIRDKCIDCGLCESTCPDMVFQFKDGVNLGMDLYHCKGCMRCVDICPTNALVKVKEGDYNQNIGNIHLINKHFDFDNTGYNSMVEGDVYDAVDSTDKSL